MSWLKKVLNKLNPEVEPIDYTSHPPEPPQPGTFFDPEPGSWDKGTAHAQSVGPARIHLQRLGPRQFQLLRPFGYCDPEPDPKTREHPVYIVPRNVDTFTCNFSSAPVLVNWIIPVLGTHFTPIVLHDGLVEHRDEGDKGSEGIGYVGKRVSRERADAIVRDAMYYQGTGFLRRWIAWVGMMIGTVVSEEGVGNTPASRRWHQILLWITLVGLIGFGLWSTAEVLGLSEVLPWMSGRDWRWRLFIGGLAAVIIPAVWAQLWGSRRRFAAILGIGMAVLLPAFAVTLVLTVLYLVIERVLALPFFKGRFTRHNEPTFKPIPVTSCVEADAAG